MQPRAELEKREGLDQVVVRTVLKPPHPVFDLVSRGEHEDRGLLAATHVAQDLESIHAGQHHVQHDQVVAVLERCVAAVDAIAHHIDGVALLREPALQVIGRLDLVFNDQDSHRFGRDCAAPAPVSR